MGWQINRAINELSNSGLSSPSYFSITNETNHDIQYEKILNDNLKDTGGKKAVIVGWLGPVFQFLSHYEEQELTDPLVLVDESSLSLYAFGLAAALIEQNETYADFTNSIKQDKAPLDNQLIKSISAELSEFVSYNPEDVWQNSLKRYNSAPTKDAFETFIKENYSNLHNFFKKVKDGNKEVQIYVGDIKNQIDADFMYLSNVLGNGESKEEQKKFFEKGVRFGCAYPYDIRLKLDELTYLPKEHSYASEVYLFVSKT
ncbi:MAG: hypothetical protein GOU98_01865 [Candidatus Altiarchaeota archaeon]|nr:hypothetical protein [Candidatus Altiarchaeota archaeon]